MFAEHFAARVTFGDAADFGEALSRTPAPDLTGTEALLRKIHHPTATALIAELAAWRRRALDRTYLETFGRFVDHDPAHRLLLEHDGIREQLAAAEGFLFNEPHRSVLVVGDSRAGKTSFVMLLASRAAARGWSVFEAGATHLVAGQQYIGQLEERLRRLAADLAAEKRVVWYVPDFVHLATGGTYHGQSASLLDQVLPAISSGRVVMVSEITAASFANVAQRRPAVLSAVELIRLPVLTSAQTDRLASDVAERLSDVAEITVDADVLSTAMHLARQYLGTFQMPGAALDLLKQTAQRVAAHDKSRLDPEDVLATLSQLTGMPSLVLDSRERVDLGALRTYFAHRVIGQDEAVDAIVDRIAMLKAGLTDPGRPIAVFLFAGPTGTGKTELAKTLAEFLFGSAERLVRLDMSEFQTAESMRKIVGDADQDKDAQSLAHRVRRQPFSVVLLDEFEKAHPQAWDLFLQVFDDGRLTDAAGQTVDFRHCIIILTSNLGATIKQGLGPGFGSAEGRFSQELVLRTVLQTFRAEFVNRLDAIIVFKPLTRELMRGILAKELARVLERRGLRDRDWAVEWESSALDFLLEKGFSPAMGARPLKRAIDRYLLAPLAATMVEHRFPEGDQFLFVRSDGRAIQVEFVDPDAAVEQAPPLEPASAVDSGPTLARMVLQPSGSADERLSLLAELRRIEDRVTDSDWAALENDVSTQTYKHGFWEREDRFSILARIALFDRIKAAVQTARRLEGRLNRSAGPNGRYSKDLIARLAAQIHVIQHGIEDAVVGAPVEMALCVQPALESSADITVTATWCDRLFAMYRRWAGRRHMQWEEIHALSGAPLVALVAGFGAARILESEVGLHLLEYEDDRGESHRVVARVRIAPSPAVLPDPPAAKRELLLSELQKNTLSGGVVRRYRLGSAPLIRDVGHGWRTGRVDLVLDGHFDLLADVLSSAGDSDAIRR
jgi:ATP-dependent Clp protease ATP-binding subunit ClpC